MLSSEERMNLNEENEKKELVCVLERPFKCSLFCQAKSEVEIFSSFGKILGVITEPETTYKNKVFQIFNDKKELLFTIDSDYFQMGVCWRNSLYGKCQETVFPIYKCNNKGDKDSGNIRDGLMTKKFSACASENNLDYPDALEIIFPDNCTYYEKYLISMCGLLIDYRFYEIDPRDKEN